MRNGGATRVMAKWPVLISGVNAPICMTLGFPTKFQFFEPWFLKFSSSHFTFPKLPIIALSIFFSNLSLQLLSKLVVVWLSFLHSLFEVRFSPSFLILFFLVVINFYFSFLFFIFIFVFRCLGILGFTLFSLFSGFPWLVALKLG